jgi:hypothetical protein
VKIKVTIAKLLLNQSQIQRILLSQYHFHLFHHSQSLKTHLKILQSQKTLKMNQNQ